MPAPVPRDRPALSTEAEQAARLWGLLWLVLRSRRHTLSPANHARVGASCEAPRAMGSSLPVLLTAPGQRLQRGEGTLDP